ncbi:ferredoxin [Patescibacteria group bacterium]
MAYRFKIDRDLCIGADTCEIIAPKSFELDEENKAVFTKSDDEKVSNGDWISGDDLPEDDETLLEAAKGCPVGAIIVEDEKGNQIHP